MTRPCQWTKQQKHLFVNANTFYTGSLAVEVLDASAQSVLMASEPLSLDSTRALVPWKDQQAGSGGNVTLESLSGRPVRLRFTLAGAGSQLWSFWLSESPCGQSHGMGTRGARTCRCQRFGRVREGRARGKSEVQTRTSR